MSNLPLLSSHGFTQGWLQYNDRYPGFEKDYRIVIQVKFGNLQPDFAIVDTGTPWCILDPEDADDLDFDYKTNHEREMTMLIRGVVYDGWLCRIPVALEAKEGEGLTVDATTFIPDISGGLSWLNPNFVGLEGFLDRIRFAVDPGMNRFYFGAITGR